MIVVSGGGTGIGAAVAQRFREAGRPVVITGRREGPLREVADRTGATPLVCDHTDPASLEHLADACTDGVEVLVNNAGGNTSLGQPDPVTLKDVAADWEANLASNVLTAVLTTAALDPVLRDGGRVVNIGSIAADTGAGSYGAAKAAVAAWTLDLAGDLGHRGYHRQRRRARVRRPHGVLPRRDPGGAPRASAGRDPHRTARGTGRHRRGRLLPGLARGAARHRPDAARRRRCLDHPLNAPILPAEQAVVTYR